jgi:hypothetical protein
MLTVDLLKGQGIPIKSRPGGAALLAFAFAVPIIAAIFMFGNYTRDRIILNNDKKDLIGIEQKILSYSEGIKFQEDTKKEIDTINSCLKEVAFVLDQQIQWSPVLEVLAESMPEYLTFSEITIRIESDQKLYPSLKDPQKNVSLSVPRRILNFTIFGDIQPESEDAALAFLRTLSTEIRLSDIIEDIRLISQTTNVENGTVLYSFECVFKT